jgi:hypothetical protein
MAEPEPEIPATILRGELAKLGGKGADKTTWQTRECALVPERLEWKNKMPGRRGHTIALDDIESVHLATQDETGACQGKPISQVIVVQCKDTHKGGKTYYLATSSAEERERWYKAMALNLSLWHKDEREEISFPGNICGGREGLCTASFPGSYKGEWDKLVAQASNGELSTACVFLTQADQGNHKADPSSAAGGCYCYALYGKPQRWGCEWFVQWQALVKEAHQLGQKIVVFYKKGHLQRYKVRMRTGKGNQTYPVEANTSSWVPYDLSEEEAANFDGTPSTAHIPGELLWGQLKEYGYEALKAMPGLGASQKAEVAWLKSQGIPFTRCDVSAGAPPRKQKKVEQRTMWLNEEDSDDDTYGEKRDDY